MYISRLMKSATRFAEDHLPQILVGVGVAGMAGAVGTAIKATPKAEKLIGEKKEELGKDELTVKETVEATWKCYIPTAVLMILATACVVGSTNINEKRKNALTAALTLAQSSIQEFKDAAKEVVGEEKAAEISEKARDNKIKNPTGSVPQVVVINGDGQLFFDPTTNAKFPSTVNKLKSVVNDLNKEMRDVCVITLNEFYTATGRGPTKGVGDGFGWDINRNGYLDLEFEPHLNDETGQTEFYINFVNPPMAL